MTLGERLLNLSAEYQAAINLREEYSQQYGDDGLAGRKPEEIAADYEAALRSLTAGAGR